MREREFFLWLINESIIIIIMVSFIIMRVVVVVLMSIVITFSFQELKRVLMGVAIVIPDMEKEMTQVGLGLCGSGEMWGHHHQPSSVIKYHVSIQALTMDFGELQ